MIVLGCFGVSPYVWAGGGMVTYEEAMNAEWANVCQGNPQGELAKRCDQTALPPDHTFPPNAGPGVGNNVGSSTGLANSAHLSDSRHSNTVSERIEQRKKEALNDSSILERLSFFINGETTQTEQVNTPYETGYNSGLGGFTVGADYFFTDKFLAGFTVGYSGTEIDFIGGSHTKLDSVTTLFYANYALTNDLFIDGYAGWTGGDFDIRRTFAYPISCACDPNVDRISAVSTATTQSNKVLAGIGFAYNMNYEALNFAPKVRFKYTETFINGYDELDGSNSGLALRYQGQDITTLQTELGFNSSYAISLPWGVVLPNIGLSYIHEFSNNTRLIHTSFVLDNNQIDMAFNTNNPERDYMETSFGLSTVLPHGVQLFINYNRIDFHRYYNQSYSVSGGLRLEI